MKSLNAFHPRGNLVSSSLISVQQAGPISTGAKCNTACALSLVGYAVGWILEIAVSQVTQNLSKSAASGMLSFESGVI
jgi:hypothetical protein